LREKNHLALTGPKPLHIRERKGREEFAEVQGQQTLPCAVTYELQAPGTKTPTPGAASPDILGVRGGGDLQ